MLCENPKTKRPKISLLTIVSTVIPSLAIDRDFEKIKKRRPLTEDQTLQSNVSSSPKRCHATEWGLGEDTSSS